MGGGRVFYTRERRADNVASKTRVLVNEARCRRVVGWMLDEGV